MKAFEQILATAMVHKKELIYQILIQGKAKIQNTNMHIQILILTS